MLSELAATISSPSSRWQQPDGYCTVPQPLHLNLQTRWKLHSWPSFAVSECHLSQIQMSNAIHCPVFRLKPSSLLLPSARCSTLRDDLSNCKSSSASHGTKWTVCGVPASSRIAFSEKRPGAWVVKTTNIAVALALSTIGTRPSAVLGVPCSNGVRFFVSLRLSRACLGK